MLTASHWSQAAPRLPSGRKESASTGGCHLPQLGHYGWAHSQVEGNVAEPEGMQIMHWQCSAACPAPPPSCLALPCRLPAKNFCMLWGGWQ